MHVYSVKRWLLGGLPLALAVLAIPFGLVPGGCSRGWKGEHSSWSVANEAGSLCLRGSTGWPSADWAQDVWKTIVSTKQRQRSAPGISVEHTERTFAWNPAAPSEPPMAGADHTRHVVIKYRELQVSFIYMLLPATVPIVWSLLNERRDRRAARRRQIGLCSACGYDLRGGDSDRCPECGRVSG